jgi:hypothetical protein
MSRKFSSHPAVTGLALGLLVGAMAGCGGRTAQPVALTTPVDSALSCDHLRAEHRVNLARIADLGGERQNAQTNNVGMLVVSPLFLDLSQSERRETEALVARNQVLEHLISDKCPAS